jgi:hypothetical protein
MFQKLFRRSVHVVPAGDQWLVVQANALEAFWYDLWDFGFGVASYNLRYVMQH